MMGSEIDHDKYIASRAFACGLVVGNVILALVWWAMS